MGTFLRSRFLVYEFKFLWLPLKEYIFPPIGCRQFLTRLVPLGQTSPYKLEEVGVQVGDYAVCFVLLGKQVLWCEVLLF